MKFITLYALVYGLAGLTRVDAKAVQNPVRARVNTEVIAQIFHKRDQEAVNVFQDQDLMTEGEESAFSELTASIKPVDTIPFDDFDFDLHIEKEYMGAESDKLVYHGAGKKGESAFTFSGPIPLLKLQYDLGNKFNTEMNYDSLVWQEKEFVFNPMAADLTVEGADLSDAEKQELVDKLIVKVNQIKEKTVAGKEEIVQGFPMDTVVPFVTMFYVTQFSQEVNITDKFFEVGSSFDHFVLLTEK